MAELTEQDVPTLRRLADFFLDRSKLGNFPRRVLCEALGGICTRIVVGIERNGRLRPTDKLDAAGRIENKPQT
jgi:hypothetical protein